MALPHSNSHRVKKMERNREFSDQSLFLMNVAKYAQLWYILYKTMLHYWSWVNHSSFVVCFKEDDMSIYIVASISKMYITCICKE